MNFTLHYSWWLLISIIYLVTTKLWAAGFSVPGQNASGLGNAYAGAAAVANDASILFYNPAGLTKLAESQIVLSGNLLILSQAFINNTNDVARPLSLVNTKENNADALALIPDIYYAYSYNNKLKLALGLTTPFGLKVKHDKNWLGRYQLIEHEASVFNINPSIAYKLTDKLSLGGGLVFQYAKNTFNHAFLTHAADGFVNLKETGWGLGYTLGLLYEFTPETRIGIGFQSSVNQHLKGTLSFEAVPGLSKADAQTDFILPESVSFSVLQQWNSQWSVMTDITWTNWSRFQDLRTTQRIGHLALPTNVDQYRWHDSWRYALGTTFQPDQHWQLRMGIAYEHNAISNQFRLADMPYGDQFWLALGCAYRFSSKITLDFGYAHLFNFQSHLNTTKRLTNEISASLQGRYNASLDVLGMQIAYRF